MDANTRASLSAAVAGKPASLRRWGSKGDAYDNSMAESFFATLETEFLWQHVFRTRSEARLAIFDFVEAFYNRERLHSSIGQLSPVEFERRFQERISLCQTEGAH